MVHGQNHGQAIMRRPACSSLLRDLQSGISVVAVRSLIRGVSTPAYLALADADLSSRVLAGVRRWWELCQLLPVIEGCLEHLLHTRLRLLHREISKALTADEVASIRYADLYADDLYSSGNSDDLGIPWEGNLRCQLPGKNLCCPVAGEQ